MGPNVTHGCGFAGLLRYLLLEPDGITPRQGAQLLGGTLAGQSLSELIDEFALVRRLRPSAAKVVMHHSLSYAAEEAPSDIQLQRDAARYLEHLGLQDFPHVVVRHADKAHLHDHIVVSKIGFGREWWDARLDKPRAQLAAALVEREFGLVEMERPKMTRRVDAAWARLVEKSTGVLATPQSMRLPAIGQTLPVPPIPAPKVPPVHPKPPPGEDGVLQRLRVRMEGIPAGLTLPEWVHALAIEGVQARPNTGGDKISGWWVQLSDSESAPVKLSAVDRSGRGPRPALGWAALQKEGKVHYDPAAHNEFVRKLAEVPFDKPVHFTVEESRIAADDYPRDPITLTWDWQPEGPIPVPKQPGMVATMVDEGIRARTPRRRSSQRIATIAIRGAEREIPSHQPRLEQDRPTVTDMAPGVRGTLARLSKVSGTRGIADAFGHGMHLDGRLPFGGPNPWPPANLGEPTARPGALSRSSNRGQASSGHQADTNPDDLTARRISSATGRGPSSSPRGGGSGMRVVRGGLEGLRYEAALAAGKRVVRALDNRKELNGAPEKKPQIKMMVASYRIDLSPEVLEAIQAHVNAFFAGEFRRKLTLLQSADKPEPREELVLDSLWELGIRTSEELAAEAIVRAQERPDAAAPAEIKHSICPSKQPLSPRESDPTEANFTRSRKHKH